MSALRAVSRVAKFMGIGLKRIFWRTQAVQRARVPVQLGRRLPLRLPPRALPRVHLRPPGPFSRLVWRSVRAGGYSHVRAVSMALWRNGSRIGSRTAFSGLSGALIWAKFQGSPENLHRIREMFSEMKITDEEKSPKVWPKDLDAYDVGSVISVGCNGAVHEARLQSPDREGRLVAGGRFASSERPKRFQMTLFDHENPPDDRELFDRAVARRKEYPYAMKLMFNFAQTSREGRILREMCKEIVPVGEKAVSRLFHSWEKPLSEKHPCIVDMKTAFVDAFPVFPGARQHYPLALPSDLHLEGLGRNRTLFILMKRYSMTLYEYLLQYHSSTKAKQVLLGQLLEALVFLERQKISHRDLKSNNILVDFDHPDEVPHLVLTDFGTCLSQGSFRVPFPHPDMDQGGNVALRPPEIKNAVPGPYKVLDFTKADLWAAGTIAVEIFTGENPFYRSLDSGKYRENEIRSLPADVEEPVQRLVSKMLKRDPRRRPDPSTAANVVGLSLFRAKSLTDLLALVGVDLSGRSRGLWVKLSRVMEFYAAETILASLAIDQANRSTASREISKAERQLRSLFLRRLDEAELPSAIAYFIGPDPPPRRYDTLL